MSEELSFKVIDGSIPVCLSAPHEYPHRRPSLTMSYKWGEKLTAKIVEDVTVRTGAWGIIQTEETSYDSNWHKVENNPYKSKLADIIQREKIKKFIDIHGLREEYKYDVGIYYPTKFTNSILLANDISNAMDKGKLKGLNICIFRCPDDMQETLGEFVADKLRVPSVQLEIARYIRESDELREELVRNISSFLVV